MKIKPIYIKLSYQAALRIKGNHDPFGVKDRKILIELGLQALICWLLMEGLPKDVFLYTVLFIIGMVNLMMGVFLCGAKLILEWYYRSALKTIEIYKNQQNKPKEDNKHE